jgi:tRNA(Ile)-lysidine synthase
MKWRSPSPAGNRIEIVRPLLGEPKSALRRYARDKRIKFREDATNAMPDFLRNRIRLELLPLLRRQYQPGLTRNVLRLMEIVGAEAEFVGQMAEDWLSQAQRRKGKHGNTAFAALPSAVQRRCLQLQLLTKGISPDFELIEKLRLKPGQAVNVGASDSTATAISRDLDGIVRRHTSPLVQFHSEFRELSLGSAGRATFSGVSIDWARQFKPGMILPKPKGGTEYFDADRVGNRIILRHWRKGDRFQPIGMSTAVKLQDLFVNQKVPRALRHNLIIAEAAEGGIFWVEGMRISERFQLTRATKRRLQWRWYRD